MEEGDNMTKRELGTLLVGFILNALIFGGYLYLKLRLITAAEAFSIVLTATLVLVTVAYVKRTADIAQATREQAEASIKMAEEMREQRYDALRPIIDFRFREWEEKRSGGALGIGARGEVPPELHGQLCNIGVGPAIDLYSFSKVNQVICPRDDFEPLKAGELSSEPKELFVSQEGSVGILTVYYKDVYGNPFRSRIEIHPIEGVGLRTMLQAKRIEEDEYDKRSHSSLSIG